MSSKAEKKFGKRVKRFLDKKEPEFKKEAAGKFATLPFMQRVRVAWMIIVGEKEKTPKRSLRWHIVQLMIERQIGLNIGKFKVGDRISYNWKARAYIASAIENRDGAHVVVEVKKFKNSESVFWTRPGHTDTTGGDAFWFRKSHFWEKEQTAPSPDIAENERKRVQETTSDDETTLRTSPGLVPIGNNLERFHRTENPRLETHDRDALPDVNIPADERI